MNDEQLDHLRVMLDRFSRETRSAEARQHAESVRRFVAQTAAPWSRATLAGHLTASAWVLDRTRTHALLLHHRKLDRWLQPGGHIDDSDASWRRAAQRELEEETGLTRFVSLGDDEVLFDVDVHAIPARKHEPAHLHYDLRFLFVADVDAIADGISHTNVQESHDCRWFALLDLANDLSLGPETQRMIELSMRPAYAGAATEVAEINENTENEECRSSS